VLPRILLDEHLPPQTAYFLNEQGFDVTPARDRGLLGKQDWELMPWCVAHGFAICTANAHHFRREHRRCQDRGEAHPGILLVEMEWTPEEIYRALRAYLEAGPKTAMLENALVELPRPAPEE
jgi:predicted nuclease of predicted toxin-antitoxin system